VRTVIRSQKEAINVNSDGSVSDSTFFTNRLGITSISDEQILKGNVSQGPDMNGKWTILKAKSDGKTTGFFVSDQKGKKFLLKLDSPAFPEMNSSTEIMCARILHAIGYNVPEYSIVYFPYEQLSIKPGIQYYDESGFKKSLNEEALKNILRDCYANSARMYRASASKIIEGNILGPMSFRAYRKEDPMDYIPHEHRREVRGLRVFCSWINNFDMRRGNTLDVLLENENGWYIKHYLIDFGSALGSHISRAKPSETGHEYAFDVVEILKSIITLGFYKRPWHRLEGIYPQTGYFSNLNFRPEKWKPHVPNYAFQNMTVNDAVWACKILRNFTDEMINSAVNAGMITNQRARDDLITKLSERRDIIINYWLGRQDY